MVTTVKTLTTALQLSAAWRPAAVQVLRIRAKLLAVSASTIDLALGKIRQEGGRQRRRPVASALRRSITVRTSAEWKDPAPGFVEADLVAHSGPSARGSFIQTLVLTNVATGSMDCAPLLAREQTRLSTVLTELRRQLPLSLQGIDTDNDTVFINEAMKAYCEQANIEFTRCRPYRKNDQAFVEQKNGAVVRRMVGYRTRGGCVARRTLSLSAPVRGLLAAVFQANSAMAHASVTDDAASAAGS
ncbi:hypothetical protein IVB18_04835 [Bradyrhizobium sp. 186]|nr:hypothetical protein IVB18_04835 [Bradyrhizobium sp. 186]